MKKTKITLVNVWKYPAHTPHFGLCSLAAYLKQKNKKIKIQIIEGFNPTKKIIKSQPDIIGYTSDTLAFNKTKKIASIIKKKLNRLTIIGGVHITAHPQSFGPPFDIGIIGEGEKTLLQITKNVSNSKTQLAKINGVIFRQNKKIIKTPPRKLITNIDKLPLPSRQLTPMANYFQKQENLFKIQRQATTLTSRGCPYHCIFCGSPVQWGSVRFHSAPYVINEILYLRKKYQIDGVMFWDDLFIAPPQRLKKIKDLILKHKLDQKIIFVGYARANLINTKACKFLKQMNVKRLIFGFETGSNRILKYLKANSVTVKDNARAIRLCRKFGISPVSGYIVGTPGETVSDLKKTYRFMKKHPLDNTQIYILTPYPGTKLWQTAITKKLIKPNIDWQKLFVQLPPINFKNFLIPTTNFLRDRVFLNPKQKNNHQYLNMINKIRKRAFIQNNLYYLKTLPINLPVFFKHLCKKFSLTA